MENREQLRENRERLGKIENSYQKIENGCAGRLLDDDPTPEVEALAPRAMHDRCTTIL